jgi:hypothetical protein
MTLLFPQPWMMHMKTKAEIAAKARALEAAMSGAGSLIERTLRELAGMLADLAEADAKPTRTCARPKCSEPATTVTGLCVAHSVRAMGDSIDRTVERKRRKK